MKTILILMFAMMGTALCSCGNSSKDSSVDSVSVDTSVVDSTAVDSVL